jgi:hypothetical protein
MQLDLCKEIDDFLTSGEGMGALQLLPKLGDLDETVLAELGAERCARIGHYLERVGRFIQRVSEYGYPDEKVGDVLTDDNLQAIWRSTSGQ